MKKLAVVIGALLGFTYAAQGQYATLIGTLQSTNGMPAANYIISFTPSQFGFVAGSGVIINTTTSCATSVDGSVVGIPNPLDAPPVTVAFTGTLTPANYFVKYAFYDASGNLTLVSPETVIQLNSTGQLIVASPTSGMPAGSVGMKVYIAASTNAETLQGSTTGSAAFIQSVPLTGGAAVPSTNTTICKQIANDAIWPSGTGYTVSLTDTSGNTLPGYPMQWQLMGPNSTINLSSGLPYYHGTVFFPTPILASPINHGLQSISGPLGLSGYNLTNVGAIGIGTTLPAWPIDVENGFINSNLGYLANGNPGGEGQCLASGGASGPDTWVNCLTSIATIFYQTVASNGSGLPQRADLNFTPSFTVADASPFTTVDLANVTTAATIGNPSSITYNAKGQITGATSGGGTTPVNRTCNANGCYRVYADGTIEQWGVSAAFPTGADTASLSITFPTSFTTTTNLSFTAHPDNCADACTGKNPISLSGDGTIAITGVTVWASGVVPTGGGGQTINNVVHAMWHAIGN